MPETYLKWPGLSENNTLIISVDKSEFGLDSAPLQHDDRIFKPKPETHITVFGAETGTALLQKIKQNPASADQLTRAFEDTDWSYTTTGDYRHLARMAEEPATVDATEESIIVLLDMPGMDRFYENLKRLHLIDKHHPVPPPHVTLYTYNCDGGIGVPGKNELDALTRARIDRP